MYQKYSYLLFLLVSVMSLQAQQTVGVFLNEERAFNGYTLFSNNTDTYLIDNCGFVVNTWESSYRPGQSVYLLENGNLLRTAMLNGNFSSGGAGGLIELFSWEGELLWSYRIAGNDFQAHHDIAPMPNGNFLVLVWERRNQATAQMAGREEAGEIWSECILELEILDNNEAKIVWEWRLWDHLVQDKFSNRDNFGTVKNNPQLVNINFLPNNQFSGGDLVHLNAIDYNAALDQIVVSSRNFSEIWIIDHSTTSAEAATHSGGRYGKGGDLLYRYGNPAAYEQASVLDQVFFHQHDVRWIPAGYPHEGKLIIFNNDAEPNRSRIEIWSPALDENGDYLIVDNSFPEVARDWDYTALGLYSSRISGAEMLPNGNVLICEGRSGEFWEVSPDKERVWKYINPVNKNGRAVSQGGEARFNDTFRATRYAPDYPAFNGKDLSPTVPVEINPWELDCMIHETNVATKSTFDSGIEILANPIQNLLLVETEKYDVSLQVFDLLGRKLLETPLQIGLNQVDVSALPKGVNIAVFTKNGKILSSEKFNKF